MEARTVMGSRPPSSNWSKWANRFVLAAIAQGTLTVGAIGFLLYDSQYPIVAGAGGAAKYVAGGGAGNWLTVGVLGFVIFGPLACAVTALFYQHLEVNLKAPYSGLSNIFGWLHLVLMNIGVTVSTWIMWIGGWRAENFLSTTAVTTYCKSTAGLADPACSVHVQVLGPLVDWIAYFALVALLGAFAGGIGYVIAWRRSMKTVKASA